MTQLRQKLNRTNVYSKVKAPNLKQLTEDSLLALFDSHLCYAAYIWGQGSSNEVDMVEHKKKLSE